MRAGVCSMQQTLTAEAASIVKQAVALAKRRGHAQVTPLHVASSMLASPSSLLRNACLQSHYHPLQFRALEVCFNVALNRLPSSSSSPLLSPYSHHTTLSNALVAALKRAQAYQRRGTTESQQQSILAVKIEQENLVISILDDPSVSRVMREAGFSSTQIKNKVEKSVSFELSSQTKEISSKLQLLGANLSQSSLVDHARKEDVLNVLNTIIHKKKNAVIVGECLATAESIVRGVMDRFEKGHVPIDLRHVQFINLPLFSLRNLPKDEVEQKLMELRCFVKSCMGRGVVLYLGDLKWISEFWSNYDERMGSFYCPVEHIVMELKRIVCGIKETNGKVFLMGVGTIQTYMRCKQGQSTLEGIWELHPVTFSADSLSLSLNLDRHDQNAGNSMQNKNQSAMMPSWLQQHKEESKTHYANNQNVYKKWNPFGSIHNEEPFHISISPSSSTSAFPTQDQNKNFHQVSTWPVIFEQKQSPKEHQFLKFESSDESDKIQVMCGPKQELLSNPNSSPNSASTSEVIGDDDDDDDDALYGFKKVNAEQMEEKSPGVCLDLNISIQDHLESK